MTAMHTPSPWRHAPESDGYMIFIGPNDESIVKGCGCCMSPFGVSKDAGHTYYNPCPEDEANARLIACAPDLLEALQAFAEFFAPQYYTNSGGEFQKVRADALAAIQKATGAA